MRCRPNFRRFHLNRQHFKTALKGHKMWFECKLRIKPGSAPHSPYLLHTMQIMMMLLWRNYSARYFISQRLKCKYFSWIISSCFIFRFFLWLFLSLCYFLHHSKPPNDYSSNFNWIIYALVAQNRNQGAVFVGMHKRKQLKHQDIAK